MTLQLRTLPPYSGPTGPLLLVIMDGYGIGEDYPGNAIARAMKPNLDRYFQQGLYTQLDAHGLAVGLPAADDMGNSEVGHNALGAGRIFAQGAKLVNQAIEEGSIFQSEVWRTIVKKHQSGNTLHFIGLLSDGNVHSHIRHLFAMLDQAAHSKITMVRIHILLDGRDVAEKSALAYIHALEEKLSSINGSYRLNYKIASGGGRMRVTMDRYNADWIIVERGYNAHVKGIGRAFGSAGEAVQTYYDDDPSMTDQYMDSFVIVENDRPIGRIIDGDSVILFNFRGDRAIEISRALTETTFKEFPRGELPDILFVGMMEYDGDLHIPRHYLVKPPSIDRTVSQYLCAMGVTSFAISETQKYGHVTYFWNGNNSGYINEALERFVEIPSDRIEFDKAPKMKACEITAATLSMLEEGRFRFVRINFANGDMVGHTGKLESAIEAIETVDACVGLLVERVKSLNGTVVITADHGNSDEMFTEKNGIRIPKTSHTLNPVPFCIVSADKEFPFALSYVENPGLANVAATLCNLLGYEEPDDYEPSLIQLIPIE